MVLVSISEDLAKVQGIDVKKYNFIYLICVALTVALGVRIVGGLMTAAIVAIPACTSKNLTKNLVQYSYGGMFLGSLACILGVIGFKLINIPAGPLIIITNTILFMISLILKK
jgi:zinc transport system permease protein